MKFSDEELSKRLEQRVGHRCVWCGIIVTYENISKDWCDPCCEECAKKFQENEDNR